MYFGGSVAITAISAVAVSRSPAMLNMVMKNSWVVSEFLLNLESPMQLIVSYVASLLLVFTI